MLYTKVGLPLTLRRLRKQRLRREKALSGSGRLSMEVCERKSYYCETDIRKSADKAVRTHFRLSDTWS
jgi:hypothetical protein